MRSIVSSVLVALSACSSVHAALVDGTPSPDANGDGGPDLDAAATQDSTLEPPTPITPATDARVAITPAFVYRLAAGTDGARVEVCSDRACTSIAATADRAGSMVTLAAPLHDGRWFYRLYGRSGDTTGTRPSAARAFVVGVAGWQIPVPFLDLDGDGRGDLVVGAPGDTIGAGSYAKSYLGTASGDFVAAGTVSRIPGHPDLNVGSALSPIGDFDGDGHGDVVIAGGMPGGSADRATVVLFGGPGGISTSRTAALQGVYAETVAGIGDVNGDGYDDFAWGDPFQRSVHIYYGGSRAIGGANVTLSSPIDGGAADNFGAAIAPAGDVNGDGYVDLVIGDPGRTVANTVGYRGAAYLYLGGPNGLDTTPHAIAIVDGTGLVNELGRQLTGIGDVDGDGYGDIVISAQWSALSTTIRDDGALYLMRGSASGFTGEPVIVHGGVFDELGLRLAAVADVTGDGIVDVVATTASGLRICPGDAIVGLGVAIAISTALVTSIGAAGDVDGDGHAELVTGQACPPSSSWCTGPGAVRVFDGASRSVRQEFDEPPSLLEAFGMTVGG